MGVKSLIFVCTLTASHVAGADEFVSPVHPYDGIQAGLDAHAVGEARRLDAINRQIGWNSLYRWQAATQISSSIFYDPYIPGFDYAYRLGPSGVGFGGGVYEDTTQGGDVYKGKYRIFPNTPQGRAQFNALRNTLRNLVDEPGTYNGANNCRTFSLGVWDAIEGNDIGTPATPPERYQSRWTDWRPGNPPDEPVWFIRLAIWISGGQ